MRHASLHDPFLGGHNALLLDFSLMVMAILRVKSRNRHFVPPGEGHVVSRKGDMAQRLLSGFHALEQYSQDVLAKHAKKRHRSYMQRIQSLNVPLCYDFEPETRQGGAEIRWERTRNSHWSSREPSGNAGGPSSTRPSTAAGVCIGPDSEEEERKPMERMKPGCESARQRRPWRSEVECIPSLDTLCQEERTGPILSTSYSHTIPSLGEQLGDSISIENSHQTRQDDTRAGWTPTSNKSKHVSDNHVADDDNPPREEIQETAATATTVSLTIEDEMKKCDIKVITVTQKTDAAGTGRVSDTQPVIYHHNKFVVYNTPPGLQKKLPTNSDYTSGSQRPAGNTRRQRGTDLLLQHDTDYVKHAIKTTHPILHTANVTKNRVNNVLLSDSSKVIIHFLSADGTKQKADFATEGKVSKEERGKSQGNGRTFFQDSKLALRAVPARETKDEPGHVGPITNGRNPKTAAEHEQLTHSKSRHESRSFSPSSPRAQSSQSLRLNNEGEARKWSYISISKPLSPPDCQLGSLQSNNNAASITSYIMEDKVRPTSGVELQHCPEPLSTKPLALESRKGRQGLVPGEISSLETDFGGQTSMEKPRETEKGGGETHVALDGVRSPSAVTEPSNAKSPKNAFSEQERKLSPIPAHHTTIPVISIPTAPTDISE